MIAIDTSVILAIALREPEADPFERLVRRDAILIGWPTLLELRMVLTGKGFANAAAIVDQLIGLPNVTTIAFDEAQYRAAERAFDRFGKGRHAAGLNMGTVFPTPSPRLPGRRCCSRDMISENRSQTTP